MCSGPTDLGVYFLSYHGVARSAMHGVWVLFFLLLVFYWFFYVLWVISFFISLYSHDIIVVVVALRSRFE